MSIYSPSNLISEPKRLRLKRNPPSKRLNLIISVIAQRLIATHIPEQLRQQNDIHLIIILLTTHSGANKRKNALQIHPVMLLQQKPQKVSHVGEPGLNRPLVLLHGPLPRRIVDQLQTELI